MPGDNDLIILQESTPATFFSAQAETVTLHAVSEGVQLVAVPDPVVQLISAPELVTLIETGSSTGAGGAPGLRIRELDGAPTVLASALLVPNGTLTDNGDTTVTYTPGPPTAHHTTHSTGGTDAIAPADIGALSGTGTAGQVALWSGAGSVSGDPRVTVGLGGLIVVGTPGYEAIYGQTDTSTAIDGEAFGAAGVGVYGSGSGTGGKGLIGEVTVTDGVPITALAPSGVTANLVEAQVNAVLAFAVGPTGRPRWVSTPPASSTDTGTVGEMAWDSGFYYVCTATNVWKRVALSTF